MDYETLNAADKLLIARDALRAAETDHYRISLDPASGGGEARVAELKERVERLRDAVKEAEAATATEAKAATEDGA